MPGVIIMLRVLAAILGLHCAAGYRHEMHLSLRPEGSSNKSTQDDGASDIQTWLIARQGPHQPNAKAPTDRKSTPSSTLAEENAAHRSG
mmetsp:Transcript_18625/g.26191  ORF Transcript_18625/g.26191 Transcript_18625/m.26191 type:complete len:89 (+) Transcript_18625:30-296(+)